MESSHVISITNEEEENNNNITQMKKNKTIVPITTYPRDSKNNNNKQKKSEQDIKKLIHSTKVGISLVLVSLLYILNPLFDQVGENAMWAIMTVVVIFEFNAGIIYNL